MKTKKTLNFRMLSAALFLMLFAAFFMVHSVDSYATAGYNTFDSPLPIEVNTVYHDSIPEIGTSNYYKFTLTEPGVVSFTFKHPVLAENEKYWTLRLYDGSDSIYERTFTGHDTDAQTSNIGLPAGEHLIRISPYSNWNFSDSEYSIIVNFSSSQNWEKERNETFITSNEISVNSEYSGSMRSSDDQDWYKFQLAAPGYVSISFNHTTMSDDSKYWAVSLFKDDSKTDSMANWDQSGYTESSKTCNIGLDAGIYYVKVSNYSSYTWSSADYSFVVNYNNSSNWEKEYNNGFANAEQISLNEVRYGSIFRGNDADFYAFNLEQSGMIMVTFDHEVVNSSSTFWEVYLYSDDDKNNNIGSWSFSGLDSGSDMKVSASAGKYYIKIVPYASYSFRDKDYHFSVSLVDDPVEAFVKRMYSEVLGRDPDEQGLRNYITALYNGSKKGADVAADFYLSREVLDKHPSNDAYVQLAYKGLMGRDSSADERVYWIEALDSGVTYHAIVAGFVGSPEFKKLCEDYGIAPGTHAVTENRDKNIGITKFVARLYTKALGRGFDVDGLNDWTGRLVRNSSKSNILNVSTNGFFHSQEFLNKNLDNTEFVSVAYRTFLGREPEPEGHAYWINQLQSGKSRDEVLAGFANSPEFANIMAQYGL